MGTAMPYRLDPVALASLLVVLSLAILTTLVSRSHADWTKVAGEWEKYRLNESQMQWFSSVHSLHKVPCCSIADGHPTLMEHREDGYYIPNPKVAPGSPWIRVPDEAMTTPSNNPIGVATVWWVDHGVGGIFIRCFVPESET
jgi:hypothetical protein